MLVLCKTENGQAHLLQIGSLSDLSESLNSYSINDYGLQTNQVNYHLRKTGRCEKREYPKILLQKDGYLLPTELTLTQLSDLEYFLTEHIGKIYCLEIDSSVYQMLR